MKHANLLIDAGAHIGQDTEFHLAKGFEVVAIEANPALAGELEKKFASEVAGGRLGILNVAIAETTGMRSMAVADDMAIWSSLSPEMVSRNEAVGTKYRYVEVPTVRFEEVLADVGIPYYLKSDIEGLDLLCVEALHGFTDRPTYLSLESHVSIGSARFRSVPGSSLNCGRWATDGSSTSINATIPASSCRLYPRRAVLSRRSSPTAPAAHSAGSSRGSGERSPRRPCALVRSGFTTTSPRFGGRWTSSKFGGAYGMVIRRLGREPGWYGLHAGLR
jgi:FkbM family methyltransferase